MSILPELVLSSVSGWCVHNLLCVNQGVGHCAVYTLGTNAFPNQWLALVDDLERSCHTDSLVAVSLRHILSCNLAGIVHGSRQGGVIGLFELVDEQHGVCVLCAFALV